MHFIESFVSFDVSVERKMSSPSNSLVKHKEKKCLLLSPVQTNDCCRKSGLYVIFKGLLCLFYVDTKSKLHLQLAESDTPTRQEDRYHSFDCSCSNKEETGRAHPLLISLAQILAVNGKC